MLPVPLRATRRLRTSYDGIDVESGDFAVDDDGKVVVWYRLRSTISTEGEPVRVIVVHRRFKEFCALEEQVGGE